MEACRRRQAAARRRRKALWVLISRYRNCVLCCWVVVAFALLSWIVVVVPFSLSLSLSFSLFFFASTFCWVVVVVVFLMSSFFMRHFFCEIVCFGNISTGLILMQQIAYAILISDFFPHWNLWNAISVSV